jgi:hypothetical protein
MLDVVGRLEDGGVFLDTRATGSPLVVQLGVTNKCEGGCWKEYSEVLGGGGVLLQQLLCADTLHAAHMPKAEFLSCNHISRVYSAGSACHDTAGTAFLF